MKYEVRDALMGPRLFVKRRVPPSSRHHESEVWQGLYRLEVEVFGLYEVQREYWEVQREENEVL
jgi:hypothetical protein